METGSPDVFQSPIEFTELPGLMVFSSSIVLA